MTQIRSRTMQRGDRCESTWPPEFGTGEKGVFHFDRESGELVDGYPPPEVEKFGTAPGLILDDMAPLRHPDTGELVSSRKRWEAIDQATGSVTSSQPIRARDRTPERRKAVFADIKQSKRRAAVELDKNEVYLSEKDRAYCRDRNEFLSKKLGINAHNITGRNSGPRKGRKARRRSTN